MIQDRLEAGVLAPIPIPQRIIPTNSKCLAHENQRREKRCRSKTNQEDSQPELVQEFSKHEKGDGAGCHCNGIKDGSKPLRNGARFLEVEGDQREVGKARGNACARIR